ncbi:HlyD family secretion protein [Flavobacterium nitrogenifigens]|uniref:HlyD family secretion protein n=1 Tax=Flavobacterium nitrogenifigens TaxID=1617283 RepID=A0A521DXY6_9FLAO|nr:HlyD family efflux transporter periplasmic adaptor subunit [Flavobacterium nitrogenifigens]KAF2333990.1 HlyD family efflux transporter periplasmic adaptor subunit [Flavobacterium nitrogenifigens]SMO76587.1 HlyD family secretion protein [Flavobacterium nitrogenifigens]
MKKIKLLYFLIPAIFMFSCNNKENDFDASGSFEAVETILSAEANGQILQLNVEEGQQLEAGQKVGFIDSTQLAINKMQLRQNEKAILSGRPQIQIQTESLKRQLDNVILDRNRTEKLVKGGVASQKQLDDINSKVAALQSQIKAQKSSLETTTENLTQQGNTVGVQLKGIEDQLSKSMIVNPIKGTVLAKYAEQYEMAVIGKPLYKIANLETLDLRAYITGTQLPQIKIGQQVKVRIDQGEKKYKEYQGTIAWISDKSEFSPKTIPTKDERANLVYAIKVRVKNDGYLKIGMYGEVLWSK